MEEKIELTKEGSEITIKRKCKKPAKIVLRNVKKIESSNAPFSPCELGMELVFDKLSEMKILL